MSENDLLFPRSHGRRALRQERKPGEYLRTPVLRSIYSRDTGCGLSCTARYFGVLRYRADLAIVCAGLIDTASMFWTKCCRFATLRFSIRHLILWLRTPSFFQRFRFRSFLDWLTWLI